MTFPKARIAVLVSGVLFVLTAGCYHHLPASDPCSVPTLRAPRRTLDQAAPAGTFEGFVLDGHFNRPLKGASVTLSHLQQTARTDSLGAFRFMQLSPGWHQVVVRSIAYLPIRDSVLLTPDSGRRRLYQILVDPVKCEPIFVLLNNRRG